MDSIRRAIRVLTTLVSLVAGITALVVALRQLKSSVRELGREMDEDNGAASGSNGRRDRDAAVEIEQI